MPNKKEEMGLMKTRSLKSWIMTAFLLVILFLSISIGVLGFSVITNEIVKKAQQQMTQHIKAANLVYEGEKESIGRSLSLVTEVDNLETIKRKASLDYLYLAESHDFPKLKSEIARKAIEGNEVGATRIISKEEIDQMDREVLKGEDIKIIQTPKARSKERDKLEDLMVLEHARPLYGEDGQVSAVLYGGKILNKNNILLDKIMNLVFEDKFYRSKPVGTVTIFQGDVRIATNVLTSEGEPAVGTRLSEKVYEKVITKGELWLDRAFVVNDWYITAYKPIRNIREDVIGILYVGMLEKPFSDMTRKVFAVFLAITSIAVLLALVISFLLTGAIIKPVKTVLDGIDKISEGQLEYRVETDASLRELNRLALSLNDMAESLDKKNKELVAAKNRREALNKRYLDLIGFVSHELKGILASTILNAYSVRDGFLGMVNFKQQKALDSVARNLDHLDATVKNFLNLSRIEKGEMTLRKRPVRMKEEIFDTALDTFQKQILEKGIRVINNVEPDLSVLCDRDMMQVVSNNLVSNAVKYGEKNGFIKIYSENRDGKFVFSVYNQGRIISESEKKNLFARFARLDSAETKREKGTGLGLFITKEIIEAHGGAIKAEPGEEGNIFIFEIAKGDE